MPLRLLQIVLPGACCDSLNELLADVDADRVWRIDTPGEHVVTNVLLRATDVESFVDAVADRFSHRDGYRIVLLPVEATQPKFEEPENEAKQNDEPNGGKGEDEKPGWKPLIGRVSREELHEDIAGSAKTNALFIAMTFLATVVAIAGLLKDSAAIIIGAMVIAPLLGPNMAFALGTTLGDVDLLKRSVRTNAVGLAVAIAVALLAGLVLTVDPSTPELAARTVVDVGDVALALAAGAAGALAFTSGAPAVVVGVMVAVALLPPTAAFGLLLGSGEVPLALQSAKLVAVNVVCINAAGVGTFLIQGVRPGTWWEAERAKKAVVRAGIAWTVVLAAILALVVFTPSSIDITSNTQAGADAAEQARTPEPKSESEPDSGSEPDSASQEGHDSPGETP